MSFFENYVYMLRMVLDILLFTWPVTLAILINQCLAAALDRPLRDPRLKRYKWVLLLTPFGLALCLVAVGIAWQVDPNPLDPPTPNWIGSSLLAMLHVFAVLTSIWVIARMRGNEWFGISFLLTLGLLVFASGQIAVACLTGGWT